MFPTSCLATLHKKVIGKKESLVLYQDLGFKILSLLQKSVLTSTLEIDIHFFLFYLLKNIVPCKVQELQKDKLQVLILTLR